MWQKRFRIGPAEPRALGVNRLMVVAVPATAECTRRFSVLNCATLPCAGLVLGVGDGGLQGLGHEAGGLARHHRQHRLRLHAGSPWIWRTTSRIFCADILTLCVMA